MSDEFKREVRKIHKARFLRDLPTMVIELTLVIGVVFIIYLLVKGA